MIVEALVIAAAIVAAALIVVWSMRRHGSRARAGATRVLVPFTAGELEPMVLDAAIRIAKAEAGTLVPAYLIVTPRRFALDAPMSQQVAAAMPLLEAVEQEALRRGVPVDARIESGRTPTHALERLWAVEDFDRIVAPAPVGRAPGFTLQDVTWILAHAPGETLILRPAGAQLLPVDATPLRPRAAAAS